MKARLFVLGIALTMLCASLLQSQTCSNKTVTATITDSDSTVWANGSYTVTATNPSGGQRPICRSTGQPITQNFSGTLNASGALSQSLPDTSQIDPAGMQWVFTIQSKTSGSPYVMLPINLTANVSLTASFSAQVAAVPLRFTCGKATYGTCFGYKTVEVSSPVSGQVFANITSGATNVCNLYANGSWVNCGVGSSTPVTFSQDLSGSATVQTVIGILGNILPTLPGSGQIKHLAYDNILGWRFYFDPLTGTDPPSGALCTAANVGQEYWASGVLPNVGITKYTCTTIAGPSRVWIANNSEQWHYVTPTNQPGTTPTQACLSTVVNNTCTWQALPSSSSTGWVNLGPVVTFASCTPSSGNAYCTYTSGTWSITNIPQTYTHLRVVLVGNLTTGINNWSVQFNGSGGTGYACQVKYWTGTSVTVNDGSTANTSNMQWGLSGASGSSESYIEIPYYSTALVVKPVDIRNTFISATNSAANNWNEVVGCGWNSAGAGITRIDLNSGSGSVVAGSIVSIYGSL